MKYLVFRGCVACEAIICSECEEAYNSMIPFVLKNSQKRSNENIHVIAADGLINQDCVTTNLGYHDMPLTCVTHGIIYLTLFCYD